ncbi:MAG: GldG family protein [Clostridia bacterium]|nr:GldG family protein [Clostridia bacterium]
MKKREKNRKSFKLNLQISQRVSAIFKNRKLKRGSIASSITAAIIISFVLLNVAVSALSAKFPLSWDLTDSKIFTLTDQSRNFIQSLEKEVEIDLLNDEKTFSESNEYFKQANTVLKQYEKFSPKIKINYIDVEKNPSYLQNNYQNEKLDTNSIVVKCQEKYKVISINDIFDVSYNYYGRSGITASKAEQELTSAIIYVTSENQPIISVLKGYGEQDYSAFANLLKKNNYNVVEVSMLTENIPEDSSCILFFGPERDLDKTGVEKIENHLNSNNTDLIFFANPKLKSCPNIDTLLAKYDVKIGAGLIFETDNKKLTTNMTLFEAVNEYVDSKYTENLKSAGTPVLVPICRPIEILNANENASTLLQYSETSGIVPTDAAKDFDFKAHISGPIPSCVVSSRGENADSQGNKPSRVLLLGSYLALAEDYLSATSLNNSQYFVNAINVLVNRENTGIIIESKSLKSNELGINSNQANLIGFIVTLILPLSILSIGIIVFIKRKNK